MSIEALVGGLIVAAIAGAVGFVWRRLPAWRGQLRRRRVLRAHGDRFDALAMRSWLLTYYAERGADDDLYELRTVTAKPRIAFLTCPGWQVPSRPTRLSVELDESQPLPRDPSPRDDATLRIWDEYIRLKHADGEEWNEPILTWRGLTDDGRMEVGWAEYYQYLSTCGALELETRRAVHGGGRTPRRDEVASDLHALTVGAVGAQAIGIAACVVYPDADGMPTLLLQKREQRLATYPGTYATVPLFGCQPTARTSRRGASFRHNLLREFGEELLGLEELTHPDRRHETDWFYDEPVMRGLRDALDAGDLEIHELGFGFDALNGEVVVAVLCHFRTSAWMDEYRRWLQNNWEITRTERLPLFSEDLDARLASLEVHPGSAFAIDLARGYLGRDRWGPAAV